VQVQDNPASPSSSGKYRRLEKRCLAAEKELERLRGAEEKLARLESAEEELARLKSAEEELARMKSAAEELAHLKRQFHALEARTAEVEEAHSRARVREKREHDRADRTEEALQAALRSFEDAQAEHMDFQRLAEEEMHRQVGEVPQTQERAKCVVCLAAEAQCAAVPCGHLALCLGCLEDCKGDSSKCCICRKPTQSWLRIFEP
jgi:DNA repair exonuclease SbcCD ATPase subunit